MLDLAPLVLRTVPCRFKGGDILLDLSHALFSSFDVDVGTRLLFKALGRDEVLASARSVLDAGSGVGVIGLAVARALPGARVVARDRDFLARAFTERNRLRNKIPNLLAEPGLIGAAGGGEALGGPFDFILSNVPAKAGAPVIQAFLAEAGAALSPGGRIGIVVVKPLVEETRSWLAAAGLEILREERGSMHRAFVCGPAAPAHSAMAPSAPGAAAAEPPQAAPFAAPAPGAAAAEPPQAAPFAAPALAAPAPAAPAPAAPTAQDVAPGPAAGGEALELDLDRFDLSAYKRCRGDFSLIGKRYRASGYWGLPDFDTIGYGQRLAAELAARAASGSLVREALVVNPGVGHATLWAALSLGPEGITAASRDLLSLAATRANLAELLADQGPARGIAYRALDALRLDELPSASFDLHLEFAEPIPEYDWISPLWEQALRLDKRGASFVLVAPPTEMQRVEKRRPAGFRLLWEKRKKGWSAAAWRRE